MDVSQTALSIWFIISGFNVSRICKALDVVHDLIGFRQTGNDGGYVSVLQAQSQCQLVLGDTGPLCNRLSSHSCQPSSLPCEEGFRLTHSLATLAIFLDHSSFPSLYLTDSADSPLLSTDRKLGGGSHATQLYSSPRSPILIGEKVVRSILRTQCLGFSFDVLAVQNFVKWLLKNRAYHNHQHGNSAGLAHLIGGPP
jgi:hypothetical protein